MDGAYYGVMIFMPIIWWILKISLSYRIYYIILRQSHSKTYIRRNKGSFWKAYLAWNFRFELSPIIFIANSIVGVILLISFPISLCYFTLWIINHKIICPVIVYCWILLILIAWFIHTIACIYDRVNPPTRKK